MPLKIIAPSWDEIHHSCIEIARKIGSDDFKPSIVIGVARGGWIPARILCDLLGVEELANLGISFYSDIATTKKTPRITQPLSTDIENQQVLMADDVADTGHSLAAGRDHVAEHHPANLKIATIYKKPWSILKPDYYVRETDAWIVFPWEQAESMRSLRIKLAEEGLTPSAIRKRLLDAGINQAIIDNSRT